MTLFRRSSLRPRSPAIPRARLAAAAACLLVAAIAALGSTRSATHAAAPRTVAVVVAARALPAGAVLRARDLSVRRWPTRLRPDGSAAAAGRLLGRRLAGPVTRGEPLTTPRLLGSELTAGLPAGTVAASVTVPGSAAGMVRAGERVDLLAAIADTGFPPAAGSATADGADPSQAAIIVQRALVLAVSRTDDVTGAPASQLVLATDRRVALRIAALEGVRRFAAVLDSS